MVFSQCGELNSQALAAVIKCPVVVALAIVGIAHAHVGGDDVEMMIPQCGESDGQAARLLP